MTARNYKTLKRKTMNNKHLFLFFVLLTGFSAASAQNRANNTVGATYHLGKDTAGLGDVRERLIQLALQNPDFEIADRKINIANYELKQAKGDWLGFIAPNLNLNEFTVKPKSSNNFFLPLWNVGVTVPLNYFSQRKNEVKVARENMYIAQAQKNERFREIRAKVLTKYEDYLMYRDLLELQNRVTQDAYVYYKQRESDFADNLIEIDDFNKAFALYKEQQEKKLQAFRNLNVAKIELEQLIGVSLDDVLKGK